MAQMWVWARAMSRGPQAAMQRLTDEGLYAGELHHYPRVDSSDRVRENDAAEAFLTQEIRLNILSTSHSTRTGTY